MSTLPLLAARTAPPATLARTTTGLSYEVPRADAAEFAALKDPVRVKITERLAALRQVSRAPGRVEDAFAAEGKRLDDSATTVKTLHYAYRNSGGNWRVLIDWRLQGREDGGSGNLSPALLDHYKRLCLANQRTNSGAYATLERAYRAGEHIPGHGSWRDHHPERATCPPELPAGWSERNFLRHGPTRFERKAFRIGRAHAADHRPKVLTTRFGLPFGAEVQMDDQEYDVQVNFLAPSWRQPKAMRPLGLDIEELLSAHQPMNGFFPTLWDAAAGKKRKRYGEFVPLFVMAYLGSYGYRDDEGGTTITGEGGTATLSAAFCERLRDHLGGRVRFVPGNSDRRPAHAGLFESAGRGNFRVKAALESARVLLRNRMADTLSFPGATGLSRDAAPQELAGREAENTRLLKRYWEMRPDRAALLRMPALEWSQFVTVATDLYAMLGDRREHDLEGWVRCGFLEHFWRPDAAGDFLPADALLALPPARQEVYQAMVEGDERLRTTRRMSPRQVWSRHVGELTPVPDHFIPLLLPAAEGHAAERVLGQDDVFEWEDQELSPDPIRYLGRVGGRMLRAGERYLTWHNPFRPAGLVVCDAAGRFLGTCPAYDPHCRADREAIRDAGRFTARIEAEKLAPGRRLFAGAAARKREDREHNRRVLAGLPVTPAEHAAARETKTLTAVAETALERRASATAGRAETTPSTTAGTTYERTPAGQPALYDPYDV